VGTERHRVVINRLMRMAIVLHDSQRGLTEKNLENELGYSRSTVYRDLKSLQEMDIGLKCETINGEARYRLRKLPIAAIAARKNRPSRSITASTSESSSSVGF